MAKRISSHPSITPARLAEFARDRAKIDAEELESLKARARAHVAAKRAAATQQTGVSSIVAALKSARVEQGLTLDEVGERSGIQKASLSRLENDPAPNPTWDTLARYAAAVGRRIVPAVVKGHEN